MVPKMCMRESTAVQVTCWFHQTLNIPKPSSCLTSVILSEAKDLR